MIAFIAVLLAVVTFAFVTYPLFRRTPASAGSNYNERLPKRGKQKGVSISKGIVKPGKGADVGEEIEKQVAELRQKKTGSCPQCGARFQEGDRFCGRCGTRLRK